MKHYVYKISNIIDDKHYIGVRSAKNPIKDLGIKYFSSSTDEEFMLEQQEFPERFEYKILEVFSTRKLAVAKEIELHDLYDVAVNESFYNRAKQTSSGFCRLNSYHTSETIERMRLAKSGENNPMWSKNHSEETKAKYSLTRSGKKSYMWGKNHSQETKDKIRTANLGKKLSEEHKDNIRISKLGKNLSKETKEKISLTLLGNIHSDETRKKQSESKLGEKNFMWGKNHSQETKDKISSSCKVSRQKRALREAFRFIIHDSEGKLIHDDIIINFRNFCVENKYPKGSFGKSYKTNEPVERGVFKGWRVQKINK